MACWCFPCGTVTYGHAILDGILVFRHGAGAGSDVGAQEIAALRAGGAVARETVVLQKSSAEGIACPHCIGYFRRLTGEGV